MNEIKEYEKLKIKYRGKKEEYRQSLEEYRELQEKYSILQDQHIILLKTMIENLNAMESIFNIADKFETKSDIFMESCLNQIQKRWEISKKEIEKILKASKENDND